MVGDALADVGRRRLEVVGVAEREDVPAAARQQPQRSVDQPDLVEIEGEVIDVMFQ
jgi:hypothetical protein